MQNLNQSDRIVLCRKGSNCGCPVLSKNEEKEDEFILTDDYEGSVRLTTEQLMMLKKAIDNMTGE